MVLWLPPCGYEKIIACRSTERDIVTGIWVSASREYLESRHPICRYDVIGVAWQASTLLVRVRVPLSAPMRGKLSDRLLVSYARDTGFDSQTRNSWYYYKKRSGFCHPFFNLEELFSFTSTFLSASHVYVRLGFKTYSVFFNLSPAFFTMFHKS